VVETNTLGALLLTYLVHSTLLLGAVWLIERTGLLGTPALRETAWRAALFGAVFTSVVQLGLAASPLTWHIAAPATARVAPVAAPVRAATPVATRTAALRTPRYAPPAPVMPVTTPRATGSDTRDTVSIAAQRTRAWLADHWLTALLALWVSVVALIGLRLAVLGWLARRELAGRNPLTEGSLVEELRWLSHTADQEPPRLMLAPRLAGPVSLPNGEICVPDWVVTRLDRRQQRALLAHELAHHRRQDPQWLLAALLVASLGWLQPLNGLARRRLAHLAELAADDWAARKVGDGRALAECLAECATHLVPGHAARFGTAMAGLRSPLVERLLQGIAMHGHRSTRLTKSLGALCVAASVFALPLVSVQAHAPETPVAPRAPASAATPATPRAAAAPRATTPTSPTPPASPAPRAPEAARAATPATPALAPRAPETPRAVKSARKSSSGLLFGNSINVSDDEYKVTISQPGHRLEMEAEGKVEFTPAEDDIASLGAGASFELMERKGGVKREFEVERGSNGALVRTYKRDGDVLPFDAEARAWLAATIPSLLRESAIDVEGRLKRLHARGGFDAVFKEIALIEGDYARAQYLGELGARYDLDAAALDRALTLARDIDSDYEQRVLLGKYLGRDLQPAALDKLYGAALGIDSDYELAELLIEGTARLPADATVRSAWFKAAARIGSDYELRRTLNAVADRPDLDEASLISVLDLAGRELEGDYELREALTPIAARATTPALVKAYTAAAARVGSDYELREALTPLVTKVKLDAAGWTAVLDATAGIGGHYERAELLIQIARRMPTDPALVKHYRRLTEGLSEHDRGRASDALLARLGT
jgi:beta-lactamase regulating signal transducer with metallopeptidase domain